MLAVQSGVASFTPGNKAGEGTIAFRRWTRKMPQPRPGGHPQNFRMPQPEPSGHTPDFRMPQPRPGGRTPNFRMPQPRLGDRIPDFRMPPPRLSGHRPNSGMPGSSDGRNALSVVEECAANPAVDRAGNQHKWLAALHGNLYNRDWHATHRGQIVRRIPSKKIGTPKEPNSHENHLFLRPRQCLPRRGTPDSPEKQKSEAFASLF